MEINKCPFCGGEGKLDGVMSARWVYCTKCLAHGAARNGKEEALEAWNRRVGEGEKV